MRLEINLKKSEIIEALRFYVEIAERNYERWSREYLIKNELKDTYDNRQFLKSEYSCSGQLYDMYDIPFIKMYIKQYDRMSLVDLGQTIRVDSGYEYYSYLLPWMEKQCAIKEE